MSQLLMTIGECHGEVGNMWHAINTFDRCIQILTEQLKKTPDWDTYFDLATVYSLKTNSAIDIKEYKLVIDMQPKYKECLDKLNKLKEDVSGANDVANAGYYSLLSLAYEKSGNHAKARECFDNLLSTRTALLPDGASYVVPYLMETKQYKEALKKINEEEKTWMSHGRDTVDYTYSNTILMNKARVLQALGRYEEAINTGMRAYNLSDSLTRRIKEQNATWLSEKMGKKVLKSYIENQDKQLTINRWANIIMGVLLFICITLIVFIIRDNRIIKNKNRVSSSLIGELSKYKTELFDRMSEHPDRVNNAASADDKASATDDKGKAVNSGETVKTEKNTDSKAHNEEYEQFLKIEKMIFEKNLFIRTKLSRTEVAAEAGMSTSHFNAVFDKYSQLTFTNYINNLRMERAAKLLKEKPLNKITINDITEDCGVNRMTFYYHFKDIYDLVDWILTEDATKAMEGCQSFDTWNEAFLDILHQIRDNKALVLNVYRSVGREQVEQYLYKLLDPMLKEFADRECRDITVQDDDKQFVVDFYKYALVGVGLEWIRRDMKTDPALMVERTGRMLQGDLRRALCRLASNKIHLEQDG